MSDAVKTQSRILPLVVGAVVVIAVVVVIIVLGGRDSSTPSGESTSTKPGHVKIEFRAMPPSTITLDGVKIGKTPITVTVPKKSGTVTAIARASVTRYNQRGAKKTFDVEQTQVFTPDHDQTVDFQRLRPTSPALGGSAAPAEPMELTPVTPGSAAK